MNNLFLEGRTIFGFSSRRSGSWIVQLSVFIAICFLLAGCEKCGKLGKHEAIVSGKKTISVPASALPSRIPQKFYWDNNSQLGIGNHMAIYFSQIKATSIRSRHNFAVVDDKGNTVFLRSLGEDPGFVEGLLLPVSVPAQIVAVKIKESDRYFILFVPLDSSKASWKKGLYSVTFRRIYSTEVRIAYIDRRMLVKLGKGIGYPKVMSSIAAAIKELNKRK